MTGKVILAAAAALSGAVAFADGLWGVNYYAPFSLDYNELKRRGVDHRKAIRDDVVHFRRLGVDYVRVHCFDRQISRRDGSLSATEHLDLMDYLVATAASNGLKTVVTPIAWFGWGPMREVDREGFSNLATMQDFTSKRELWALQARFLAEFAAHTNRYTGFAYGKDPAVIAFECVNEPVYPMDWPQTEVTDYIDTLVAALRAGGAEQPVYYNSWNGYNEALGKSKADGASCSAYPLGLLAGHALRGRQLGRIRESTLKPDAALDGKLKMTYEFDAADTLGAYLYPAMAKMLRGEGVGLAAQFQYDPLALADANKNWHTHYLNLVYTPRKAVSFAIGGRAFKYVPKGEKFAPQAERMGFGPFLVDATRDLSQMVTETEYLYSSDPVTPPPAPEKLEHVWGCGRSGVVASDGSGAYFLDRAAAGVWRLQLYPNVITVSDPFVENNDVKTRLVAGDVRLVVRLPDLGGGFAVAETESGALRPAAKDGSAVLPPGDYVLFRTDAADALSRARALALPRYVAPESPCDPPVAKLRAELPSQWAAGHPLPMAVESVFCDNVVAEFVSAESSRTQRVEVAGAEIPAGRLGAEDWDVTLRGTGRYGAVRYPAAGSLRLRLLKDYRDWNYLDKPLAVAESPFQIRTDSALQRDFFPQSPTGTVIVVRARAKAAAIKTFELTMVEPDLKSWSYAVPLTEAWRTVRLPVAEGRYRGEWPWVPKRREGDRPDVGRIACLRFSYEPVKTEGAAFEVASVNVE